MRVLFLLHAHPELQAGGTEIFARDLFRTLRDLGVSGLLLAGTAAHQRPASPGTPFQSVGSAPDEILAWTGGFDPFFMSQIDLHGLSQPLSELLRDQRRTLGRYDARFTGTDVSAAGDSTEYDPSDTGITGAFVSSFHDYLSRDLGYDSDLSYRPTYYQRNIQWDFKHSPPGSRGPYGTNQADVALDLSAAMRENPHLMVYSLNGIYDFATPFFGTEYDLAHMQVDQRVRGNLRFAYYPSGHMVYLNPDALRSMKADLARFYDEAAPR